MVDPRLLCRKHLLGEHVELHMLAGSLRRGISLQGFFENKLIEIHNVARRHEQLVREMKRRGFIRDAMFAHRIGHHVKPLFGGD